MWVNAWTNEWKEHLDLQGRENLEHREEKSYRYFFKIYTADFTTPIVHLRYQRFGKVKLLAQIILGDARLNCVSQVPDIGNLILKCQEELDSPYTDMVKGHFSRITLADYFQKIQSIIQCSLGSIYHIVQQQKWNGEQSGPGLASAACRISLELTGGVHKSVATMVVSILPMLMLPPPFFWSVNMS